MAKHKDFQKICKRFTSHYAEDEGQKRYNEWLRSKNYSEEKPLSSQKENEKKEFLCPLRGVEIKESDLEYHIEGFIATTHIDEAHKYDSEDGIPDRITKETLDSFAHQMNSNKRSRIMGVHHSEGRPYNAEYYGEADIFNTPAKVVELPDGEYGLQVDTVLLKSDPETPNIISQFESEELNSFSITYDTNGFMTTDFEIVGEKLIRVLHPDTTLYGYTAASNPVNPNAVALKYGFKEFKELMSTTVQINQEANAMSEQKEEKEQPQELKGEESPAKGHVNAAPSGLEGPSNDAEEKEFKAWKNHKKDIESKEIIDKTAEKVASMVLEKLEVKEKVIRPTNIETDSNPMSIEMKEFVEMIEAPEKVEIKEQFRRCSSLMDKNELDWREMKSTPAESRKYPNFRVNGRKLEFKSLGLTSNQNSDGDYLQSAAELADIYDPAIYNGLNQAVVTWNVLAKDDYSSKGNNKVQFTLKTAANASAAFYTGNSVSTGNVDRLKFETKFKKCQVGVSVDGDMIAAARGGPVNDVFAQEVMDSADDLLAVINAALYAEVGLETAAGPIGFEYIADSAGNTSLYNLTRGAGNLLAPDSAGDTYIDQASAVISMGNLRAAKRQALLEGAKKQNLVFFCNHVQGDMLRNKFDDARRLLSSRDTDFGFTTDLFPDGIPVFEDKDANTDDWFLVDLETHRAGIWVPPTLERLGKSSDSEDAFIKSYLCTYNRAPRRLVQIHSCATS